jgi:F-type H+-transporting ATPase subunit a
LVKSIVKKMFIFSPLEQFELVVYLPFSFFNFFDVTITNATFYGFLICIFLFFFFNMALWRDNLYLPTNVQQLLEMSYLFVVSLVKQQSGHGGYRFFPIFYTIFMFILTSNFLGLVPFGFTVTGHIVVTGLIGLAFNMAFFFLGFRLHGLHFLGLFVPSGVPAVLLPLIVVIEVMSYLLRPFSMSLRLFANMMAGHTLLFILSSFVLSMFFNGGNLGIFGSVVCFFIVCAVVGLEMGIAFLQAYVFLVLLCIYVSDALHPKH